MTEIRICQGDIRPVESFNTILSDRVGIPTLSPVWDLSRPDSMTIRDAKGYSRLFSGLVMRRSPARVSERGLFQDFLSRSSRLKLEHDLVRGFDISVVPYHVRMDLKAWGLVLHPAGRVLEVTPREDGLLDLSYQGGYCRSKQDWRRLAGRRPPDEADEVRQFYNQVRVLAAHRTVVAGTVGFGLWEALWMSFDHERAFRMVSEEQDFVRTVIDHWQRFHLEAVAAMLDAGIKLILFREHPKGFHAPGMTAKLDALLGDRFRELTRTVHSRGGSVILDCDDDEIFETDYPGQWGFDGIGPLRFRDEEDLLAARRCLNHQLILIGTLANDDMYSPLARERSYVRRLIVTNRPSLSARTLAKEVDEPHTSREGLRLAS
jgi:hypothetical protein